MQRFLLISCLVFSAFVFTSALAFAQDPTPPAVNAADNNEMSETYLRILRQKDQAEPDTQRSLADLSNERPREQFVTKKTNNMIVAMLFHKLTRTRPDFENWARLSARYRDAPESQKQAVLQEVMQNLRTQFELMGRDEPIHIESYVTLRQYSPEREGFFIDEFRDDTFFTYQFNGEYYAVVPTDLMDYEWIAINRATMELIGGHLNERNQLFMRLTLAPTGGDASTKARLANGHENWLLASRIMDIELWSPKDRTLLWRSNEDFYRRKNELLNLYR